MLSKLGARFGFTVVAALVMVFGLGDAAHAQNLPPPGAYVPIPNFVGVGAGLLFRKAINDRFSGVQPTAPTLINIAFQDFPPEQDGMEFYCHDCQPVTPCTGGGAGALVLGERGAFSCISGSFSDVTGGDLSGPLGDATVNTVLNGLLPLTTNYNGPFSLTGNSGNGSDQLSAANVNGAINPRAYGATGLRTSGTCTTTAGSNVVELAGIGDFKNGQGVMCLHAGAANTATAPSAFTVLATDPSAAGSTAWTYSICTFDGVTGQMSTCATMTATNTASLNSNLSGNNNLLHWTKGTNGTATVIYNQTGVIGVIPINVTSFRDVGQGVESFLEIPTSPPGSDLNRRLSVIITGGAGTRFLTVNTAATVAVSGQFFTHDDTAAIQAAFAAAQSLHTVLRFPSGNYNYFGAGLGGSTAAASFSIAGEAPLVAASSEAIGSPGQTIIFLPAGGSFIDDSSTLIQLQLRDLTIVGGTHQVRLSSTAPVGHGMKEILGNSFVGFTGCGVCSAGTNAPYFRVERNLFQGLDPNASTGLGYSAGNDASSIHSNVFTSLRVAIADAGASFGRVYANNDFIRSGTVQPFSRIDIWFSQNSGGNVKIDGSRHGSENLIAGDYRILDADSDSNPLVGDEFPVAPHAGYGVGEIVLDGAITTGTAALTSNTAHFLTSAHVNDWVRVTGAGRQGACLCELVAQISTVNSDTQVTLGASAISTVSSGPVIFGTPSNLTRHRGITLVNSWFSEGQPATIPLIPWVYTTNRTITGWSLLNNYDDSNSPNIMFLPAMASTSISHNNKIAGTYGIGLGTSGSTDQGAYPSNEPDAVVSDDSSQQRLTWSQPPNFQTTPNSAGATDFLPNTPVNSFTAEATVSKVPIVDRDGGADAVELTYSVPGATAGLVANFTPTQSGQSWLTFDYRKGSTGSLAHFTAAITTAASPAFTGNGFLNGRQLPAPETGGWTSVSLPFLAKDTTTPLRIYFQAVSPEIGTIDIGRVHVYQHETAVDLAEFTVADNAYFNQGWSLKSNAITYSGSMTPDLSKGAVQAITITNGSAFSIQNPIGIPTQSGYFPNWTLYLKNTSGGASGTITLGSAFSPTGAGSIGPLASGAVAIYHFGYNGTVHILNTGTAPPAPTTLKPASFAVAGLPVCNAGSDTSYVTVTDATLASCLEGSLIVGGSTTYCIAICKNGTGWVHP